MDWREFTKLHALLEAYYPVIYKLFEVIPVGRAGLLFHYDSGHPEKTPLVLSAHQDVVEPGAWNSGRKNLFPALMKMASSGTGYDRLQTPLPGRNGSRGSRLFRWIPSFL